MHFPYNQLSWHEMKDEEMFNINTDGDDSQIKYVKRKEMRGNVRYQAARQRARDPRHCHTLPDRHGENSQPGPLSWYQRHYNAPVRNKLKNKKKKMMIRHPDPYKKLEMTLDIEAVLTVADTRDRPDVRRRVVG